MQGGEGPDTEPGNPAAEPSRGCWRQISKTSAQVLLVHLNRYPVDSHTRLPLSSIVVLARTLTVVAQNLRFLYSLKLIIDVGASWLWNACAARA